MPMRLLAMIGFALVTSLLSCPDLAWSQRPSEPAPLGALESPIGRVLSVSGTVTVERTALVVSQVAVTGSAIQLKDKDLVYRGDTIQTGGDSKASLTFADGTAFNISSNARMTLNEFVYDPNSKANSSLFSLVKGAFTFVAGKVAKTGNMKIDTPAATMGIRGTTPHVVIAEDGTVKFSTLVEEQK
jgi:hypothetical protein